MPQTAPRRPATQQPRRLPRPLCSGLIRRLAGFFFAATLALPDAAADDARQFLITETGKVDALLSSLPEAHRKQASLAPIARALAAGYPRDFGGLEIDAAGKLRVLIAGASLVFDDGKTKTFDERMESPDIEDMFAQIYPLENPADTLPADFDPGRVRIEQMFLALYGDSKEAVAAACETVDFCGNRVRFSKRCGASAALEKVSAELAPVLEKKPALRAYVIELGGTFAWRKIAGTDRLSNHSFATAIDLNVKKSAYWRWSPPATLATFSRKDWPVEIVEAFEKHGFIWGGKWHHYDTMHFEYRPELLAFARARKK